MIAAGAGCRRCTRRGWRRSPSACTARRRRRAGSASTKPRRRVDDAHSILSRRPAVRALYAYLRDHPLRRAPDHELRHSFPDSRAAAHAGRCGLRADQRGRAVPHGAAAGGRRDTRRRAHAGAADGGRRIAGGRADGFTAWLLHGVTGSGKTEVYLRAIAAMPADAGALVLVPEISLTHQVVERVRARFGDAVAVLHSQPRCGERWDEWRRIARGAARIVVGARSAVFAPLRRLGAHHRRRRARRCRTSRRTASTTTAATSP